MVARACKVGARRRVQWHSGDEDPPRYGDIMRHPVTGSTYLVLSVGPAYGRPGEDWTLQLEGKGLAGKPLPGRTTIDYAIHWTGRSWHRDA